MPFFSALFILLKRVTINFVDEGTLATSRQAKHAELILKCIWKRARSVEDDLGDNILDPIALLRIIEDFLQTLPPTEWRRRAQTNIPLGDMPLRTVKVIIQHVVSKYGGERVYDQLSAAFDEPENTHAYAYIFRLGTSSQVASFLPLVLTCPQLILFQSTRLPRSQRISLRHLRQLAQSHLPPRRPPRRTVVEPQPLPCPTSPLPMKSNRR